MTTAAQALAQACAAGVERLDAQRLLAHRLQRPRSWLLAHDDAVLPQPLAQGWVADVRRLADGEPLAYLLGECEFHGLRLKVNPDVLIPRPDTETLVDWALERLAACRVARIGAVGGVGGEEIIEIVDLGTGSGAIALAMAQGADPALAGPGAPATRITATDASPAALALARRNATDLGFAHASEAGAGTRPAAQPLEFVEGHWWQAIGGRRFHLALSNPPYIAADDPHLPALRHEPMRALTPGGDGLDALREIVAGAPSHLHRGGWLLLEHGWDQAGSVAGMMDSAGFTEVATRADLASRPRCTAGRWPGP